MTAPRDSVAKLRGLIHPGADQDGVFGRGETLISNAVNAVVWDVTARLAVPDPRSEADSAAIDVSWPSDGTPERRSRRSSRCIGSDYIEHDFALGIPYTLA
jgi:hypothetical protein